jgi:hypothetical protein
MYKSTQHHIPNKEIINLTGIALSFVHDVRHKQTLAKSFSFLFIYMARPQVADGGTASDMEGSCE